MTAGVVLPVVTNTSLSQQIAFPCHGDLVLSVLQVGSVEQQFTTVAQSMD